MILSYQTMLRNLIKIKELLTTENIFEIVYIKTIMI